ncbi:MAG: TraB/GumN family protein [Desulfobacteraceae bacterium]
MSDETSGAVHRIADREREFILVGTAHVSAESVDLVDRVIREEKPDTVAVELCESRHKALTQKEHWKDMDLVKVIREKKASVLLMNFILAHFQRRLGKNLGIQPGEEMIRAVRTAEDCGAGLHLADRDIRVTLTRAWRTMKTWRKIKLFFQMVASWGGMDELTAEDIENLKKKDVLEALLMEMGEAMPEVRRTLIEERDLYLAEKIRTAPGGKVVAVVGAGHVPGILKHWRDEVDLAALESVPPPGPWRRVFKWGLPALILGLIAAGFFKAGSAAGGEMIRWWILANAVFGGLGAAAALAHPVTILSAVAASPLTSLNPMMAAGWVAGLVEAFIGRPKVRDFEALAEDLSSFRGFWHNKITRILLVVLFTNIGSSLGTFVAIPLMVKAFS